QTQYVNVSFYNRLLQKLDLDQGLDDTDYFSSLRCETGDNLASRLSDLNTKLIADDSSNTITSHIFNNSDWEAMQLVFNDLISELNNEMCDTSLKDYKTSTGST